MLLGLIQGADTEEWRRMVEVNLLGLLYCTHTALPLMRDGGGGDVVNVASVAGRTAAMGSGVYNMTKWGVVGFSEALRQEGAPHRRPRHLRRARLRRNRAPGPQQEPDGGRAIEQMREATGKVLEASGHRERGRLRALAAEARLDQRDPRAALGPDPLKR